MANLKVEKNLLDILNYRSMYISIYELSYSFSKVLDFFFYP